MCGRFVRRRDSAEYAELLDAELSEPISPSYNIAPTQPVLAARAPEPMPEPTPEPAQLVALRWGLIPSWSKGPDHRFSMINARAETIAEKPAYRSAFRHRRCLIVADGFYEWRRQGSRKQPYYIHLHDHAPFAMAGLWERWQNPQGDTVDSCTIITTKANEAISDIHDRMPVILAPKDYAAWLDRNTDGDELQNFLQAFPAQAMSSYPVSTLVNKPSNNSEACLEPLPAKDNS